MMHCPKCNLEYQDDAVQCSDCEVTLVSGPRSEPIKEVHPEIELERVHVAGDPATIPIIKSLLDDAEIEYLVKGEGVQDLFGWGRIGTGFNFVTGPVEFFVASENASTAREILGHLTDEVPEEAPDEAAP
jgi:hypothetical protein